MTRVSFSRAALAIAFCCCLVATGPAASGETFGAKLRRLAAAAAISNSRSSPPLRPAPAWIPNHAYARGEAVQNGARLYICYTAGTSAASGGPTGTRYTTIIDGSAQWVYYGLPVVSTPDPAAPVVTSTITTSVLTAAGITKFFNPVTSPSSFVFGGGLPTPAPANPTTQVGFRAVHAYASKSGGTTGFDDGTNTYFWSATFVTDAPKVAIGVSSPAPATIIIDGRKLFPGAYKGATVANPIWFVLDFANAGGRKKRTITLEHSFNNRFAGVGVDPASTLSAPDATDKVRVAFLGSSIEAGGARFPILGSLGWPVQVSKLLGWADPWNLGIGGTGYISNLGGQTFSYIQHVDDAIRISPDIVVVGGPINDAGIATPSAITSAAVQLFQKLRTASPDVVIIAMGTFPGSSGPSAVRSKSEAAIEDAVQQLADPRLFFIPVISGSSGSIITGTGTTASPNGTGNADFYISADGTHPTQAGIDYQAVVYAERIKSIVVNLLP